MVCNIVIRRAMRNLSKPTMSAMEYVIRETKRRMKEKGLDQTNVIFGTSENYPLIPVHVEQKKSGDWEVYYNINYITKFAGDYIRLNFLIGIVMNQIFRNVTVAPNAIVISSQSSR